MQHLNNQNAYEISPARRARLVVAVGLAGLALAAPSAMARPDFAGTSPNAASAAASQVDLRSPDAQDAATQAAGPQTSSLAGTTDATPAPTPAAAPAAGKSADDGFDWGSAGIGAGVSGALILMASAGAVATQRRRTRLAH
jgi:hypothetical protein